MEEGGDSVLSSQEPLVKGYAPMSISYITTPLTLFSFVLALLIAYVLSPLLSSRFFPNYHQLPREKQVYWNTLPGSTINAIVVLTLILIAILTGTLDIFEYYASSQSVYGFAAMQYIFGYFIGDMIVCLSYESLRDISLILHHISSLSSVLLGLVFEGRWMILIMARFLTELSTPFVNLLWMCIFMGIPKTSRLYRFAGYSMTFTFLGTRIGFMPLMWWITYVILVQEESEKDVIPFAVKASVVILMICLDVLNVLWSVKIVKGCFKMSRAGKSAKE